MKILTVMTNSRKFRVASRISLPFRDVEQVKKKRGSIVSSQLDDLSGDVYISR